jgi:hypothetical protein
MCLAWIIDRTTKNYDTVSPRREPRSERARERKTPITCMMLGYKFVLFRRIALNHANIQVSSRHRPATNNPAGHQARMGSLPK